MRRRTMVLGGSLLPLLSWPSRMASAFTSKSAAASTNRTVAVIGAGLAGLAAARHLQGSGANVFILEAQNIVGGRLKTDRSLGIAFDQGASWIHGPIGNPITPIAEKSGAKTFLTDDDNVAVFDIDGQEYKDAKLDRSERKYNKALEKLKGHINDSFETAFFRQFPQRSNDRLWTYMLSAFLEFDTGADLSHLSSLDFYDDEAFDGEDLIVTNGFDKVADYLSRDLDLRLNTLVKKIDYAKDKIMIETNTGTVEADLALITVPLGILKTGGIAFNPELSSATQEAIDGLKMGSVNKFLCVWDSAFWNDDLQYIGVTPTERGKFNYFLNVGKFADAKALMTFAFGDFSVATEDMSDEDVIEMIMSHLRSIYGREIPYPITMMRTKWNRDAFTLGSYSHATTGARSSLFERFESPIDGKVLFAGEHTSRDYRGTVHGAYLSGIRAAEQILKGL